MIMMKWYSYHQPKVAKLNKIEKEEILLELASSSPGYVLSNYFFDEVSTTSFVILSSLSMYASPHATLSTLYFAS